MALQGYTDQPCPQWDSKPQPQYVSRPWITPDSRRLNPLGHHDRDKMIQWGQVNSPFYGKLYDGIVCCCKMKLSHKRLTKSLKFP